MRFLPFLLSYASVAAIDWTPSNSGCERRLSGNTSGTNTSGDDEGEGENIAVIQSHDGPDCIVGGVETAYPTKVYIGGPCSALKNLKPTKDFRWVVMDTVYAALVKKGTNDEAPFKMEEMAQFGRDKTNYAETGVYIMQYFAEAGKQHAGIFLSTTSYLAKKAFNFSVNSFVVDKQGGARIEACVAPCGDKGKGGACTNGVCPKDRPLEALPGDYKYSVLAAAFDISDTHQNTSYKTGATGNGWAAVAEAYGTGTSGSKTLEGELVVYQTIDFTNMKVDTMNLISPAGKSVKYSDMKGCDLSKGAACPADQVYEVAKMDVKSAKQSNYYGFPRLYNVGTYTMAGDKVTTTPSATKTVKITAMKPDDATKKAMEMKKTNKIILLRYAFDVTGITASATGGTMMVYDPTVASIDKFTASGEKKSTADIKKQVDALKSGKEASAAVATKVYAAVATVFIALIGAAY